MLGDRRGMTSAGRDNPPLPHDLRSARGDMWEAFARPGTATFRGGPRGTRFTHGKPHMFRSLRSARQSTLRRGLGASAKKPFYLALALATIAAIGLVGAAPAQADTQLGCNYPRVCFYPTFAYVNAHHPTASYKDITSSWQTLGYQARGAAGVMNTRNDDGARLHFTNGTIVCLRPNTLLNAGAYGTVDKIRIMDSPSC
jgi:hypothetical protein